MKLEDVVESLNRHIESVRKSNNKEPFMGHLILQKNVVSSNTMKVYKVFSINLWYIDRINNKKFITLKLQNTLRALESQEELIWKELDSKFCVELFNWVQSEYYKQIIDNNYGIEE